MTLQSSGDAVEYSGDGRFLTKAPDQVTLSTHGFSVYEDKGSLIIVDSDGKQSARFSTYTIFSRAMLSNGNILIASPVGDTFLHIYNSAGRLLKSFGKIDNYVLPDVDDAEKQFLRRGKVVIDVADNIYYVFHYIPLIQKYSPDGKLLFERQVQGEAIDMQQELARKFFSTKTPGSVGGIDIINSGAIDRETDHLWICMNGSSETGVVYEYNDKGEKIQEYALEIDSPVASAQRITGVKDIALTRSNLYAVIGPGQTGAVIFNRSDSSANGDVTTQTEPPCGTSQPWNACTFNCPGVTCSGGQPTTTSSDGSRLDCRQALQETLAPGYILISASCTTYPPGTGGTPPHPRGACKDDIIICRNGQNFTSSVTIDCPAPPSNSCSTGGGGGACEIGFECPAFNPEAPPPQTCCYSPILIDVSGNGFDLTGNPDGVAFDLNNDGSSDHLSWTAANSDDAWLALDRNGNGRVDNGSELFGNFTPQPRSPNPNGFLALAEFDKPEHGGNNDGMVNRQDAIFSSLRLWQDTNHNGISESSELHRLPSLGLASIDPDYKESKRRDRYGNQFRYRAKVYDARGANVGRWAWDIFLVPSR